MGDIGMRLVAKLLGLTLFCGIAVFGAQPAEAILITQPDISSNGTLCVDVRASSSVLGAVVWAYPCNATIAEQWQFVGAQLQGLMPNRCLATQNGRMADGTPVVLTSCTGRPSQSWGYYKNQIYLLGTSECLDSEAGPFQQLAIHKCSATAPSQKWTLR
jgi:hypothetical protein